MNEPPDTSEYTYITDLENCITTNTSDTDTSNTDPADTDPADTDITLFITKSIKCLENIYETNYEAINDDLFNIISSECTITTTTTTSTTTSENVDIKPQCSGNYLMVVLGSLTRLHNFIDDLKNKVEEIRKNNTIDEVDDTIDDTGEEIDDTIDDTGEEVDDTIDDTGEEVDDTIEDSAKELITTILASDIIDELSVFILFGLDEILKLISSIIKGTIVHHKIHKEEKKIRDIIIVFIAIYEYNQLIILVNNTINEIKSKIKIISEDIFDLIIKLLTDFLNILYTIKNDTPPLPETLNLLTNSFRLPFNPIPESSSNIHNIYCNKLNNSFKNQTIDPKLHKINRRINNRCLNNPENNINYNNKPNKFNYSYYANKNKIRNPLYHKCN